MNIDSRIIVDTSAIKRFPDNHQELFVAKGLHAQWGRRNVPAISNPSSWSWKKQIIAADKSRDLKSDKVGVSIPTASDSFPILLIRAQLWFFDAPHCRVLVKYVHILCIGIASGPCFLTVLQLLTLHNRTRNSDRPFRYLLGFSSGCWSTSQCYTSPRR